MTHLIAESLGGQGQPVLLVHGFGADRASWTGIAPALAEGFSVLAAELPGHGRMAAVDPGSDVPALLAQFDPLVEALPAGPVHLVGHSLGGAVAMLLADRHGERVGSLSLLAPAGLGGELDANFLAALPALETAADALALLQGLVVNPRLVPAAVGELLLRHLETPGVRERLVAMAALLPAVAADARALARNWQAAERPPVLLLWGDEDTINPPPPEVPIPGSQVRHERLTGCGHLPHIEKRTDVTRLLREFLVQYRQ